MSNSVALLLLHSPLYHPPKCGMLGITKFKRIKAFIILFHTFQINGLVAQLGERTVRIDRFTHRLASAGPKFWRKSSLENVKTQNHQIPLFILKNGQKAVIWAHSSAGRAPGSQSGSRGFEPLWVHHEWKITANFGGDFLFDHNNTTDENSFWPLYRNTGGELSMLTARDFAYLWLGIATGESLGFLYIIARAAGSARTSS